MNKRISALLDTLAQLYPSPRSELNFRNEYELVTSVLLSAQCTDRKVNEITPVLYRHYSDFNQLAKARLEDVETIIRPINYYRTTSKNLIRLAQIVQEKHHGKLPQEHASLFSLPGLGNKTANVVLSEMGVTPTFPVDTHVFRVSKRLNLARGDTVLGVERELTKRFESSLWRNLHHWLIFHGRRVCKAQRPLCESCVFAKKICPRIGVKETKLTQAARESRTRSTSSAHS